MKTLLFRLSGHLPCRIISDNGKPYLERYYLFTLFGVRFYLHRFVGSDPARGLHDHPWPWAGSMVLSGWYWEELRGMEQSPIAQVMAELNGTTGIVRRRVRWFNWLTGDTFHRVVLPTETYSIKNIEGYHLGWGSRDASCWTLFFHRAAYTKPWGFMRPIEHHAAALWVPFNYDPDDKTKNGTGTPGAWWSTCPVGNAEVRRMPL